ncbi:MAG: flagellar hook-basal body complex protein [Candidatus Riflebacteria bacterium]|nr:flagellar hook-basal body complex protein [Candidatus Riflebacteria bacterium]
MFFSLRVYCPIFFDWAGIRLKGTTGSLVATCRENRTTTMMRSLFTGVSGLQQEQTRMDVLSNNIANVNTIGFKKGRAEFQDLMSQTLRDSTQSVGNVGGTNPQQVGLGVKLAAVDTIMDQGAIEGTGKSTDLAIEGNGFLMVKNATGNYAFTRDGNLSVNPNYDLVGNDTGYKIQGWLATQDSSTGQLDIKQNAINPYDLNLTKYLKKMAHKSTFITYSSNLDSSSDERDVKMGQDKLTFKDSTGNFENLQVKFKKIDSEHWDWSAASDTQGNVANGTITTDSDGKITATTCQPMGVGAQVGNPYFTYDPDGTPLPATATTLVNTLGNTGNGFSSGISVSGTGIKDETISVIFDGGDANHANSYRVVGSVSGFLGSGTISGTPAKISGDKGKQLFLANWTPQQNTSFDLVYTRDRYANDPTPETTTATVTFPQNTTFTSSQVVDKINLSLKQQGIPATAYYDSVLGQISLSSNLTGSNRTLTLQNRQGTAQDLSDLGFTADATVKGTGTSSPEAWAEAQAKVPPYLDAVNNFGQDVQFTITDQSGKSALVSLPATVGGVAQTYTRSDILSAINTALRSNNVSVTAQLVDSSGTGNPDRLMLIGTGQGAGQKILIGGDQNTLLATVGLRPNTAPGTAFEAYTGTPGIGTFNQNGVAFTVTEGSIPWKPNDSMTMTTTAQKGQAESVNVYVPTPNQTPLAFTTTVNTPEGTQTYSITGAVQQGATHDTSIKVYDTLGAAHELVTTWEHTNSETKEWSYKISYAKDDPEVVTWLKDPANGVLDPSKPTDVELSRANDALIKNRKGTIYFGTDGKIDLGKSNVPQISFTPKGSDEVDIDLNMALATEYDSPFTTAAKDQDGYEMGMMQSIAFETDGTITGIYSNGQKLPVGRVAVASFQNPAGLDKGGQNLYTTSPNSGNPLVGQAGTGDRGTIVPASLEMSNVDIAEEFTNLIITQRAFEANSKIITTSDEILQNVVNLKR